MQRKWRAELIGDGDDSSKQTKKWREWCEQEHQRRWPPPIISNNNSNSKKYNRSACSTAAGVGNPPLQSGTADNNDDFILSDNDDGGSSGTTTAAAATDADVDGFTGRERKAEAFICWLCRRTSISNTNIHSNRDSAFCYIYLYNKAIS